MKKLLCLAVVAILSLNSLSAQTFKFGNIDSDAIVVEMPEFKQAQKELEELASKYESQISTMSEEFQKKYKELQQQADSLPQAIAEAKYQEVQQLQQRIENFQQMARNDMQQQQQQKYAPIFDKVSKAIAAVGEKGEFTYIFQISSNAIAYKSEKNTVDVGPLVKAELGIK